jgi:hypothetical protein
LPQQHAGSPIVISNEILYILVVVLLIAIMLLMVLTTARARREPVRVRVGGDEEAEPDGDVVRADHPPYARLLGLRRWLAGVTVRRLYARMVHEAARRGRPRLPVQTPYDYLPQLRDAFPGAGPEVRRITDAYVAAHYGQVPDTEEELAAIRTAWEHVRAQPRKPTKE